MIEASTQISIRPARREHAGQIARLHREGIDQGFLSRLGHSCLREIYLGILDHPQTIGFVATAGRKVVGFFIVTLSVSGLYRKVLRERFLLLGMATWPYMLKVSIIRHAIETLRYPSLVPADLPDAEILSVAIDASFRHQGIGSRLMRTALQALRERGIPAVRVMAGAKLAAANAYYQRLGFTLRATIPHHGEPMNVYVLEL